MNDNETIGLGIFCVLAITIILIFNYFAYIPYLINTRMSELGRLNYDSEKDCMCRVSTKDFTDSEFYYLKHGTMKNYGK